MMPLSNRAADVMLYYWTHNRHKVRHGAASAVLFNILHADQVGVADLLRRYLASGDAGAPYDLAEQISYVLRDEPATEAEAYHVTHACCILIVKGEDAKIFPNAEIVTRYRLIPSLILCGRRHVCSAEQENFDTCLLLILQAIW